MSKTKKGKDIKHLFYLVGKAFSLIGVKLTMISIVSIMLFSAQNFFANYLIARCMANLLDVLLYGGEIWIPLISFLIYFVIFNITLALGFWGLQYVSTYGAKQVRLKVFRKALTISSDEANLRDTSQLQARLGDDVSGAVNLASFGPASWLMPYVAGVGSFVAIWAIQPLLLIPVIAIALVELFVNFKLAPKMRNLSESTINQKADVGEIFANNCRGAESIRNFSVKDSAIKSFSKACIELVRSNLTLTIFSSKLSILGSIASWVGFTGTLIFGLFLTNWFVISLPNLMLSSNIACLVKVMLSGIGDNWTGIQSVMVQSDRILAILDTEDIGALLPNLPTNSPKNSTVQSNYLQVSDLTFRYSQEQTVLENFKLSVKKGEIAIVLGESGSGKSTLLALIMGLVNPQNGKILLDGLDCSKYNRLSRTNHVHYILQETELFDTSIEENILLGFGDPTKGRREDAVNAAKLAEIHDFILTLPNDYATEVGEAGKNLSGGQRQRILIARALVNNVKLLLLDEPTSALDATTEAAIIKTIRKIADAGVAVVMVTHREQLTEYADKLYRVC